MDATPRVDAGLSYPLARPVLLFALAVLSISAMIDGRLPQFPLWSPAQALSIAAVITVIIVVTTRRPGPLSRRQLAVAIVPALMCTALLLSLQRNGWSVLVLGYLCSYAAFLIPRGHPVAGTASAGAIFTGLVVYRYVYGIPLSVETDLVVQPFVMILACWGLFLISRSIAENRSRAVAQQFLTLAQTDTVRSASAEERRATREIPDLAEPVLRRIVAGEPLTDAMRAELIAADGAVRDLIRLDLPRHAGFAQAIAAARERGTDVRLIGSEDPSGTPLGEALARKLIALLDTEGLVRATARFLPESLGGSVSLLIEGEGWIRRYEFDPDGNLLRRTG